MSVTTEALLDSSTVPSLSELTEIQSFDDGGVVLNTRSGQLYSCNHVTLAYLEMVDGERSIAEISEAIAEAYGEPLAEVQSDLLDISAEFAREGLVTFR